MISYHWLPRSRTPTDFWWWSSSIARAWTATGIRRCPGARRPWYWAGGTAFSCISPSVCWSGADWHIPSSPAIPPTLGLATCGRKAPGVFDKPPSQNLWKLKTRLTLFVAPQTPTPTTLKKLRPTARAEVNTLNLLTSSFLDSTADTPRGAGARENRTGISHSMWSSPWSQVRAAAWYRSGCTSPSDAASKRQSATFGE